MDNRTEGGGEIRLLCVAAVISMLSPLQLFSDDYTKILILQSIHYLIFVFISASTKKYYQGSLSDQYHIVKFSNVYFTCNCW